MFKRIFATALAAGLLAGVGVTALQEITTTPLIRHAEQFERGPGAEPQRLGTPDRSLLPKAHGHGLPTPHVHIAGQSRAHEAPGVHGHLTNEARAHGPVVLGGEGAGAGIPDIAFTAAANILTAVGFALVLVACFALSGRRVGGREGLLWGIAGFAAVSLAPALGLPPEVPGALAADLTARQGWWLLCVAATAGGLWLLVFRGVGRWTVAGLLLIAAPHLVGAPAPSEFGGTAPPELAAHFVAASLVTAAVFWAGLGWLSGTFWNRQA